MRLGLDYLPATTHWSGPGRYARELVRALVRLDGAPELALYEVGRAPRLVGEPALGLAGARVARLRRAWPRTLAERLALPRCGPADRALGGVDLFHRILPGTPRLARARTTIALAELPEPGSAEEHAWRRALEEASAVFVFCAELQRRAAERFALPPARFALVPVGCEHWARDLAAPVARAEPARLVVLERSPARRSELERAVRALGRRVETVFVHERGAAEAELPELLASASALVHLPAAAGTAVTPLEALALGTPVVVPRHAAFVAALGAQAFWAEDLAGAIAAALDSARDPAAARARAAQAAPFTWERSARAHVAVWNALAECPSAHSPTN